MFLVRVVARCCSLLFVVVWCCLLSSCLLLLFGGDSRWLFIGVVSRCLLKSACHGVVVV